MDARRALRLAAAVARRFLLAMCAVVACLWPVAAQAQEAVGGPQAVSALNAQRAAHGLPPGVVEVPEWSRACALHMHYLTLNGGGLSHDENPGAPGYTPEGAWAGSSSVLTSSDLDGWFKDGDPRSNPWENAPIHLMQTLAPALSRTGASLGCLVTWPGYSRAAPEPRMYSYPSEGTTGWRREETASELPFVPGDFVGLPRGTTTGPHLYLLAEGVDRGRLTAAEVTGPQGAVEARVVDNQTPELGSYLPPGGIVIPVQPLVPGGTYVVSSVFQSGDVALPYMFTFRTAKLPAFTTVSVNAAGVRVSSQNPQPVFVRLLRLPTRAPVGERSLAIGEVWPLPLYGARYEVCLEQQESEIHTATATCTKRAFHSEPDVVLGKPRRKGNRVVFPIVGGVAAGQRATVRVQRLYRACRRPSCPWREFARSTRELVVPSVGALTFRRPGRPRRMIEVELITPKFARGERLYARRHQSQTFKRR